MFTSRPGRSRGKQELLIHKSWNKAYQEKYADDPARLEEHFDKTVPLTPV